MHSISEQTPLLVQEENNGCNLILYLGGLLGFVVFLGFIYGIGDLLTR